ncbi:hypothetical protein PR202_ga09448 [Eleusine coracana subsp. coracana]|uniref:Protein kinase domain-containing protein n=1 Tax=Eleusine coracana subsp. coracana TaxID=191504 RepID=A0AAV5C2L0_ELECO|nr:hypothetical protein PR202_ga09448 [Eleusine coracana subsp. coracana]
MSIQEKQFKNEVKNLMKVRNQNIVRFVGYCCETWEICMKHCSEQIFAEMPQRLLCFEYMPKGSLDKYISGMITRLQLTFQYVEFYKAPRQFLSNSLSENS